MNSQDNEPSSGRPHDLEERTYEFARDIRRALKIIKFREIAESDRDQLLRASGSVGSNYIESVEATSKKDSTHRLRISRKEAKESVYWLRLILDQLNGVNSNDLESLKQEAHELKLILSSLIAKREN